ncbi:hypothetical protein [Rhizorhabdus sp. FW153]|uniref:hypothetical protein n=1 Tax=Rhizorhabdus sp. FW153 TaxID=3400216 RepID=UPI003CF8CD3B
MTKWITIALALLASTSPVALPAREAKGVIELRAVPVALDPSKAYLLFRSSRAKSGMLGIENTFVRVPSLAETEAWLSARKVAYEAALPDLHKKAKGEPVPTIDEFSFDYDGPDNSFSTHTDRFLVDGAELRTFLLEVPAGEYVVYGVSVGGRALITCNCLGTVAFDARPGVIVNIGTLYADKVHKQSPLTQLESNVGPSMFRYGWIMGQALVPPKNGEPTPEVLRTFPVENARFRAIGPFHDRHAVNVNRLAPIPGVLAYDHGKVVDLNPAQAAAAR